MNNCNPRILVEEKYLTVLQCKSCKRVGLSFHNILIGFSPRGFNTFSKSVIALDFDKVCIREGSLTPFVILNSCHEDIQFNFSREEFLQLKSGLAKAQLLLEAVNILNQ
ncbi:DUF6686 family protein [Flexithrix dorotheae]|uniref:DUF6686 family protein n=1 Tax=Flexithrix dorotheae TaxID=70993 RepID=UPI0012F9A0F6|nr:DUF6686 family protein [Flexithrix dorotheae]